MDDTKAVSDATQESSSADSREMEASSSKDSVQYETYRRVLAEKKKRDQELSELRDQVNMLQTSQKQREDEELRKKEDWKQLLEQREQELAQVKDQFNGLQTRQVISEKARAFLNEVGGLKHDRYLELVDFDQIGYDSESGSIDELSLKKVADSFRTEHDALLAVKDTAKIPNTAPKSSVKADEDKESRLSRIASSGIF